MSVYRQLPPRRWHVLYRAPLGRRLRASVDVVAFGMIALLSLGLLVGAIVAGSGLVLVGPALAGLCTGVSLLGVTWVAHLADVAERTVDTVAPLEGDARRCRVGAGSEQWTLPVAPDELREGRAIRIRYSDAGPYEGSSERSRVILAVEVLDR